jgi:hypothetical protein
MDAVPIVPPLFRAAKTRHFTSYKQATDHELLTALRAEVAAMNVARYASAVALFWRLRHGD